MDDPFEIQNLTENKNSHQNIDTFVNSVELHKNNIYIVGSGSYGKVYSDGNLAAKIYKNCDDVYVEYAAMKLLEKTPNVTREVSLVNLTKMHLVMPLYDKTLSYTYKLTKKHIFDIVRTLYDAFSVGLIHRDIKQTNIFISHTSNQNQNSIVNLGDWGVSTWLLYTKFLDNFPCEYIANASFRAPELLLSIINKKWRVKYDEKIDIWAFGMMLIELLFDTDIHLYGVDESNNMQAQNILQLYSFLPELSEISLNQTTFNQNKSDPGFTEKKILSPIVENDPEKIMPTHTHTYTYADADKPNVTQNRQTISTPNTKKMLKFICSNPVFIKNLKHQDEQLVDLLLWMTISCPKNRPTYHEILQHPYFSAISNNDIYPPITPRLSILTLQPYTINENYTNEMLCNIIKNMYNICNSICATNTYSGANISFESMILAFHLYCDNNSSNPTMCFDINKILACLSIVNNICDNISTPICSFLNYTQNISLSEFTDIKMNIIRQNNVYKVFAYLIVLNIMDENELKILKSTQYKSVILHSCCFSSKVDLYTKTMWICNQINVKVPRWISDLSESNSYKIAVNEMKIISKICHF